MKINIEKRHKSIPTLRAVPDGDLFILLENGDAYFKTGCTTRADAPICYCYSLRTGKGEYLDFDTKVRLVHEITIVADDFPKN